MVQGSGCLIFDALFAAYDAAGHVLNDTNSGYEYDAEGRQTGTYNQLNGLTGYVYDAEGRRAMKVLVNHFGTPQATTTVENEYLLGLDGEQVSVLGATGNWLWTNVYAGGKQLATYDSAGTHFTLTDWLGTKRAEVNITGASTVAMGEQCQNLPFGDGQNCTGADVNQLHFTGKQRDLESTNDYFGARYYASNIAGRFLTPDRPFVDQNNSDPQSWNLYSYVRDNPLSNVDPNGQDCIYTDGNGGAYIQGGDCISNKDSGIFVGGIIDGNSLQYDSSTNRFSFSYTPDGAGPGTIGVGVIQGPDLNAGFDAGSLGAAVFGAQNASTWNNAAGVVNAAGGLGVSIMAPWAAAAASCTSGQSMGACAANMAISLLPEVAELRAGATLLRSARGLNVAEILERAGGFAQATKDFEALPGAEKTLGSIRTKSLPDGSTAVLRNFSGDGRPTLEIQNPTGTTKFRYN